MYTPTYALDTFWQPAAYNNVSATRLGAVALVRGLIGVIYHPPWAYAYIICERICL